MTQTRVPDRTERLLATERRSDIRVENGRILTSLPDRDAPHSKRFEGFYGRVYNRVIQTPRLRKIVFSLWGSANALEDLDSFVADAVAASSSADPIILDIPSGGGTLLPFLVRESFRGTVVEVDLADSMLRRAVTRHDELSPDFETVFLRADALDVPLASGLADLVISINGLHVVHDHARFLSEIARVTKPGGRLWLITPVDGPSARSKLILAAARALDVTPRTPPTLNGLRAELDEAGFDELRDYGGKSIVGLAMQKR